MITNSPNYIKDTQNRRNSKKTCLRHTITKLLANKEENTQECLGRSDITHCMKNTCMYENSTFHADMTEVPMRFSSDPREAGRWYKEHL
jgi:hypothetical protein